MMFSAATLANLNEFAHIVWGNPQALMGRLQPQGVEYIDLGNYFPAFEELFAGILRHDKILVRDEYRAALQALQTDAYENGAYVIGQPGIGKTYFLVYILVHLLRHRQPVALQLLNGHPFYMLFKDTVGLYPLEDVAPLYACPFVWALCDSNAHIQHPDGIFKGSSHQIRIIQTTQPEASRWKGWSEQIGAQCYIMDIWSEEEVVHLAILLELNVERLTNLAKKWGNIPRTLLQSIHEQDRQVKYEYAALALDVIEECRAMMRGARNLDFPLDATSSYYFLRPRKTNKGTIDRRLYYVHIPTQNLRCMLAKALRGQSNHIKLEFYNVLSLPAETRQAANFIYESWFHSFISVGRPIKCQWVTWGTDDDRVQLPTELQGTNILTPATQDALTSRTPPYYWIPPTRYLPGVDGVLVLKTEIFVFRVALRWEHRTPIEGMRKLREDLPHDLRGLPWRVVFVGPEQDQIKAISGAWAGELYFPTEKTCVPVAWSVVDPVWDDAPYTPYRDESDPMPSESDEEMVELVTMVTE